MVRMLLNVIDSNYVSLKSRLTINLKKHKIWTVQNKVHTKKIHDYSLYLERNKRRSLYFNKKKTVFFLSERLRTKLN